MHTKKYRASPLTDKKNRTVSGGGKKISSKLKIYPPPSKIKWSVPNTNGIVVARNKNCSEVARNINCKQTNGSEVARNINCRY